MRQSLKDRSLSNNKIVADTLNQTQEKRFADYLRVKKDEVEFIIKNQRTMIKSETTGSLYLPSQKKLPSAIQTDRSYLPPLTENSSLAPLFIQNAESVTKSPGEFRAVESVVTNDTHQYQTVKPLFDKD